VKWDVTNIGDQLIITVDHVQMTLISCKLADFDRIFEKLILQVQVMAAFELS